MTMHLSTPCILAMVLAIAQAGPASACTPAIDLNGKPVVSKKIQPRATVVVEGYVELSPPSRKATLPVARLIPRKYFKGPRLPSYALNYIPNSCTVAFPTDRRVRQRVSLVPYAAGYMIVEVQRVR